MRAELELIMDKIDTDKQFLLSVFDLSIGSYLYKYLPASKILNEYQSGQLFFEDLYSKGHINLSLSSHKKNGSGKVKVFEPITVDFNKKEVMQEIPVNSPVTLMPKSQNDFFSSFGLGGTAEVMDLFVQKNEATRLCTDNAELKSDNKSLKAENERLKEEQLKEKYDYDKAKDKNDSTMGLMAGILPHLPTIVSSLKGAMNPSIGLNGSEMVFNSLVKNNFAENLKTIDDEMVSVLAQINKGVETNTEFGTELMTLLQKFQLWQ